jgi:peptidoglycan/xylan/chitin deacetylase (PgdA/CDA1 family)
MAPHVVKEPATIDPNKRRARWLPSPIIRASIGLHGAGMAGLALMPSLWAEILALLTSNHALLATGMHPRSKMLGANIVSAPQADGMAPTIVLSFDDGPDPDVTPHVLDILDRHGATASFFVIGERAIRHPELVRETLARGHSIENHTYHHPWSFAAWTPGAMMRELTSAQSAIIKACGEAPIFFRAPAGLRNPLLDPVLAQLDLSLVSWSKRAYDGVQRCPEKALSRLTNKMAPGQILVMHDGNAAQSIAGIPLVMEILPRLLKAIGANGLRAVSLRQALGLYV